MDIRKLQRAIVDGLEDVKAQNIMVFNTEHLSPLFERVIIASGNSNRQTKALASSVRDAVKSSGFPVMRTEGEENGEWIIVDCGAAVAHIMQPAIRDYYHLEEIWGSKPVRLKMGATPGAAAGRSMASSSASDDDEPAPKSRKTASRASRASASADQAEAPDAPKARRAPTGSAARDGVERVTGTKSRSSSATPRSAPKPDAKPRGAAPSRARVTTTTGTKASGATSTTTRSAPTKSAAGKTPARKTSARKPEGTGAAKPRASSTRSAAPRTAAKTVAKPASKAAGTATRRPAAAAKKTKARS